MEGKRDPTRVLPPVIMGITGALEALQKKNNAVIRKAKADAAALEGKGAIFGGAVASLRNRSKQESQEP